MEQTKRRQVNNDDDENNNKRQKLSITTRTDQNQFKTCFEDLSNDLFYEIFDYLDHYHIYQAFYILNQRFKHLLVNSTYPLEINLSTISKFNFLHYSNRIIYPNKHRIKFLRITNSFLANEIFSFRSMHENYGQLQTLILENMLYEHLRSILLSIECHLPQLTTLFVDICNGTAFLNTIYGQIYSIKSLNYCKLTFKSHYHFESLSIDNQSLSSIKYFILNTTLYLKNLDLILSRLPNLCYLSINYLVDSHSRFSHKKLHASLLKSLTKLSLKVQNLDFNQFEELILDYFSSIEILYLSVDDDRTYLNAQRWEHLITNHMTNFKIFDFQCTSARRITDFLHNHHAIEKFSSSFWIEHQWFFNNRYEQAGSYHKNFLYSTNPYRRHDYTLYWSREDNFGQDTNFNQVSCLRINGEQAKNTSEKSFPNVTELTFNVSFILPKNPIITTLNSIVCLSKITKLIIKRSQFPFKPFIQLLSATIHLSSLTVSSIPTDDNVQYEEDELFEKVSMINTIKSFIIHECCTFKKLQLLINLFPRLEELISRMKRKEFLSIMTFLLTKPKHLCFLCHLDAPKVALKEVKKLIKDTKIIDAYEIKHIDKKLHLWW